MIRWTTTLSWMKRKSAHSLRMGRLKLFIKDFDCNYLPIRLINKLFEIKTMVESFFGGPGGSGGGG